ncbi:helix-turn-helix transcriptional regulator, partial [Streptomyces rameus]
MPRWKALPEDLDPQIREFTGRLRQLVDGSGLSVAVLADRTGYSKTSWERYLGGGLLAPKGAVIALAEATGTHPGHLTTLWELAERAWSRAEMRHDTTMDALRVSQARAALGEAGASPEKGTRTAARRAGGSAAVPGIAGPAGVSPTIPAQSADPETGARDSAEGPEGAGASLPVKNSWGLAGYRGPSQAGGRPPAGP